MGTEAQEPATGQARGLPSGVYERQSWRPPALRVAESLVSRVTRGAWPVHNAARLSSWHEQFTRRVQPWSGWSPLSLEYFPEKLSSEGGNALIQHPPHPSLLPSGRRNQIEHSLSRPAIRLAILRSIYIAGTMTPSQGGSLAEASLKPRDQIRWRSLPIVDAPMLQRRLALSVSPTPRREVRGGFPAPQPPFAPASQGADRTKAVSGIFPQVQQPVARELFKSSQRVPAMPSSLREAHGAIEKLIERTVLPVPLPGLELRLVSPEKQSSPIDRPLDTADGRQPKADVSTSPTTTSASLAPPQLDINAVADKVYQMLQRRQQLERERRGLY